MSATKDNRTAGLDTMVGEMYKTDVEESSTGYTLGWDIVVSYSEKDINDNLRRKWFKAREDSHRNMLTAIDIHQSSFDDETGSYKYSWRTLELGAPRIEFEGAAVMEPAVHLVLPVEGIYYQKSDKAKAKIGEKRKQLNVSNPFDVRLSGIRLGSVKGKYETVMEPKNNGQISSVDTLPVPVESSKKTVLFREDESKPTNDNFENAWVVLDFPMEGANLNVDLSCNLIQDKTDPDLYTQAMAQMNTFRGALNSYFKEGPARIDILEYALATIKNVPEYNDNIAVDLTPKSFRFATCKSDLQEDATLPLHPHADLQALWIGQWTKHKIAPIPSGYTASILISPYLAYSAMLKPGLEKDGNFKVDTMLDKKEGGVSFTARYQPSWYVPWNYYDYEGKVYDCRLEIDGWNKDLKGDPVSFKIWQKSGSSDPIAKIDWEFSVDNQWTDTSKNKRFEAFGNRIQFMQENMRTEYKLHQELPLDIKVSDSNFTFDINTDNINTMWNIQTHPRDADGDWFDRASTAMNNFVSPSPPEEIHKKREEWMKGLKLAVDFHAVGLGFFLTTNLLNPGAKVIQLDADVLRFPRDILLVGDVVQGIDIIKEAP